MLGDKNRNFVICGSIFLTAVMCSLLLTARIVRATPGPDNAAAKATFQAKCAMCHGQNGAGSSVGKSMNVPDLRAPIVQNLPDAELARVISDGKGGMPSFKGSLSEEQIHSVVMHIRALHQKN